MEQPPHVTSDHAAAAEQREAEDRRASYLELFFDLVFVYAITQITELVADDTSAGGFARGAIVLGLIWWAWSAFAWMTNAIDLNGTIGRAALLAAAVGSFMVALAVPDAFGDDALWFAAPYLVVRVMHLVVYVYGIRDDRVYQQAVIRSAPFWLLSPLIVVASAPIDADIRVWVWFGAIGMDLLGAAIAGRQEYHVSASHFAERYQLFIIIAIGESIVAVGVGAAELERDLAFGLASTVAVTGAALLWWAYFDFAGIGGERALHRTEGARRGRMARDVYTFFHFPMVAGIILFAVATKKIVAHPGDPLTGGGRVALAAGLGLYMLAFVCARWRIIRTVAWERLAAAATIALMVLVTRNVDALAVLALALALLTGWIVAEAVRLKEMRRRLRVA